MLLYILCFLSHELALDVAQTLAGFYAFIVALNDYGYDPSVLLGLGLGWSNSAIICTLDGVKTTACGWVAVRSCESL